VSLSAVDMLAARLLRLTAAMLALAMNEQLSSARVAYSWPGRVNDAIFSQ